MANARDAIEGIEFAPDPYACLDGADAMVLITEWDMFRALDTAKMKQLLKSPIVVDLRNVYRPEEMLQAGITYFSIGR